MPGMSPRLKAKRGRFGAGGLTGPVLKILTPVDGASIVGSPTTLFTASASDDILGDLSSSIEWFVQGAGSPLATGFGSPTVATGASVDLSAFLLLGSPAVASPAVGSPARTQVVVARVSDGVNVRTSSITVTVAPVNR